MIGTYLRAALCTALCLALWTKPQSAMAGANPFLGEIETFAFNFCPVGWAALNGRLLPINQNQALFSLLGTTYGGDGQITFALPTWARIFPIASSRKARMVQSPESPAILRTKLRISLAPSGVCTTSGWNISP